MSRTPSVGANWKMNLDRAGAEALARDVCDRLGDSPGAEVAVFVPFPYLLEVGRVIRETGSAVRLGAQDLSEHDNGAFTGEVSTAMLLDCGVQTVLAGHSERRHVIGESDQLVGAKARKALDSGLDVILCVGETLEQRQAGETNAINERQIRAGLEGVSPGDMARVTIAYEPVWAIGTGMTATPGDAQNAHATIRALLASMFSSALAQETRIQYGGSVKPGNAGELMAQPDIDGGLIGGASLNADDFRAIVRACP